MSDNENDQYLGDEYHFVEEPDMGLDAPASTDEATKPSKTPSKTSNLFDIEQIKDFFSQNSPARHAVVGVGLLVILFVIYKVLSGLFFGEKSTSTLPKAPIVKTSVAVPMTPAPEPISTPAPAPLPDVSHDITALKSKLTVIDDAQVNLQNQVTSINNQLATINTNLNAVTEKLTTLNNQLMQLNTIVQEHAAEVAVFKEYIRVKQKAAKRIYPKHDRVIYYLNAVIPGRAWLIANNGNTLTVRVGTPIKGYGVVRFIDAIQGRVLTSSGKVIRFSQDDS